MALVHHLHNQQELGHSYQVIGVTMLDDSYFYPYLFLFVVSFSHTTTLQIKSVLKLKLLRATQNLGIHLSL